MVSTQKEQFKSELGKVTIANKPTEQRSKDVIINEAKAQSDVVEIVSHCLSGVKE